MMRYLNGVFEDVVGISIYPIFSLLVFVIFFVLLFWWVMRLDKKSIDEFKNIPLNDK